MTTTTTVILPGGVDDPTAPSGGNTYDRRLCQGLAAVGRPVREVALAGYWPDPDSAATAELTRSLAVLPDGAVVLLDGLVACGVPEVVVPQSRRLRVVVLVHLPLRDETGLPAVLAAELDSREGETLRAASAVVATGARAARRLTEHHGLAADRIHVVTPGTDHAPLGPGTDGVSRLLCVASVIPRKGHDLLVEALSTVADLPWDCVCVGPLDRNPAHAARLRRLIRRHGLDGRVRLTGPRSGDGLASAYAAADLVVLPSRAETYGMVVAEALARGIPVLATRVGGVPEALGTDPGGGLPGVLVPPDDAAALAAALHRWFGADSLRRRLRTSARHRRRTLGDWDGAARRMTAVLAAVEQAQPPLAEAS